MIFGPQFCTADAVFNHESSLFLRTQAVYAANLNGEPPAVMHFTFRQVVEQLEDLRIAEGVANALGFEHFRQRCRGAENGLEMSAVAPPN